MLNGKVAQFLPGVTSLEAGVQIYKSIKSYKSKVAQHGTIAFKLVDEWLVQTALPRR